MANNNIPKVGQDVYINSAFYIDRGEDDRVGGLAEVIEVKQQMSGGNPNCTFIRVKEYPGTMMNWDQFLAKEQDKLKAQFGNSRAYHDPDFG